MAKRGRPKKEIDQNTEIPVIRLDSLTSINDIDMTEFGFEFEMFSDDSSEVVEDDYNEELPEEPKSKLGDIYQRAKLFLNFSAEVV